MDVRPRPEVLAGLGSGMSLWATRTGGKRTKSPAETRVSARTRPLLMRTSPLRMIR